MSYGKYITRCSPNCPYEWCEILTDTPPEEQQQGDGNGNSSNSSSSDGDNQSSNARQGSRDSKGDSQGNSQSSQGPSRSNNGAGQHDSNGGQDNDGDSQDNRPQESQGQQGADSGNQGSEGTRPSPEEVKQELKKPPKPEYKPVFKEGAKTPKDIIGGGRQAGNGETGLEDLGKHDNRLKVITDKVFQARLRNVMKDNAYDRRVRGRKRGKLDMKSLYKVPAKVENVFTLKEARKNKHYNVVLMVDQSGSMFNGDNWDYNSMMGGHGKGSLIDTAADCATFLAKSLDKADIDYAVIGYDSSYRWHKTIEQTATDDKLNKLKYDITNTGGGGTALVDPLKAVFNKLKRTPEYQNIVICISDGEPEDVDMVRHVVNGNRHVADFIDVGIHYRPVMHNGITVNNLEELKPLVIAELKKRIKRG